MRDWLKRFVCNHEWETTYMRHTDSTGRGEAASLLEVFKQLQYVDFSYWDEPYDYCTKCSKQDHFFRCEHVWCPAIDDGSAPLYNGIKPKRIAVCSKCKTPLYRVSGKLSPSPYI